jgi:hypothetical protein
MVEVLKPLIWIHFSFFCQWVCTPQIKNIDYWTFPHLFDHKWGFHFLFFKIFFFLGNKIHIILINKINIVCMKSDMSNYRMHFNCTWKDMWTFTRDKLYILKPLFERFYLVSFKPKWRSVNDCSGYCEGLPRRPFELPKLKVMREPTHTL